jgi:hypothetical protein
MISFTLLERLPPVPSEQARPRISLTSRRRSDQLQSAGKDLGPLGVDDGSHAARKLPPNVVKLLALYRKPARSWTREEKARVYELVRDWTGEDHKAFADFIEDHL